MGAVYSNFMLAETVKALARECGFELAGIAPAAPLADFARYRRWLEEGMAGEMRYLTGQRAALREDPRSLLPGARSVICAGKLYNTPDPPRGPDDARISRYAWGEEYHTVVRCGLEHLLEKIRAIEPCEAKICVDTAPLLERSLARLAGLGWIGKNTCLINEPLGSWFFLGEIITTLDLEPGSPPPDRCGTCTRCIEACPTEAIVPDGRGWTLDSSLCISYLTIELRGPIPEELREKVGPHVFGCDICQDVCPWNSRAPLTDDPAFFAVPVSLREAAALDEAGFRERFRESPVSRVRHAGLLRNIAVALGNAGTHGKTLAELSRHENPIVREHATWALQRQAAQDPPQ